MSTSTPKLLRYVYKPIEKPDGLRMLEILPGTDDSEIHINLSHQPLGSLDKCEALSYEWGSNDRRHDIICDGRVIKGTSNLITVLHHLRHRAVATPLAKMKFLWIDAICIDQDDGKDKDKQLPLMSNIYRNSGAVLMWIGEETGLSSEAFEIISLLNQTAEKFERFQDLGFEVAGGFGLGNGLQLQQLLSKRAWPDVLNVLASRSYFTRLWIMQEVALANEETSQVLCGSLSCSWLDFNRAARLLNCCTPLRRSIDAEASVINTVGNLRSMQIVLHRAVPEQSIEAGPAEQDGGRHGENSDPMFASVVNSDIPTKIKIRSSVGFPLMASLGHTEIQQRRVSKGHDRVFALLGMVKEYTSELLLPPHYDMPAEETFERATFVMVLESQLLNNFIWMDVFCERPKLPSWVGFSDFEPQNRFPCPLDHITAKINHPITFEFGDRVVCRHDVFKFVEGYIPLPLDELFGLSLPSPILVARGFVCDHVTTVSQNFHKGNFRPEILRAYQDLQLRHPRSGNGPETVLRALWSLLTLSDNQRQPTEQSASLQENFLILFSNWVLEDFDITHEVIEVNMSLRLSKEPPHPLVTRLFLQCSDSGSSSYSEEDLKLFLGYAERGVGARAMYFLEHFNLYRENGVTTGHYGRNLFFSSSAYMGIGPMGDYRPGRLPAIQVGDKVVILARLGLPVILRPLGDGTHSLVGPVHIPGIVDEPLLQAANMPPLEDIRIR